MFHQIVSTVGASSIRSANAAHQRGSAGRDVWMYSPMSLLGAGVVRWIAVIDRRWGFNALETAWILVSISGVLSPERAARPGAPRA